MKRFIKTVAIGLLCFALCLPLFFFSISKQEDSFSYDAYFSALSQLYQQYNPLMDEESQSRFASMRLIVLNYDGEDFGAVAKAVDTHDKMAVLQYDSEAAAQRAWQAMQAQGMMVEPDGKGTLLSDKGTMHPAGSARVGTPAFISKYQMDYEDVTVAVIDTGVMLDHPALEGRFLNGGYDLTREANENAYYDVEERVSSYYHATAVTGVIVDNTPDSVKILPYKIIDAETGSFDTSSLAAAIFSAIEQQVSVINISLATEYGKNVIQNAVNKAVEKGICVCVSAGNYHDDVNKRYPAATQGCITVSAIDDNGSIADFSCYGDAVDFCACGVSVRTSSISSEGNPVYARASGTSFSSPYIAALCANIKSMHLALTKDEVYQVLCDFSDDLGDAGYDVYYGNGCPNISNMVYQTEDYCYRLPEGTLEVYQMRDYTADTQPWKLFAPKLLQVTLADAIERIGDYAFYNMSRADFIMRHTYDSIGRYAFYRCARLPSLSFSQEVIAIGGGALEGIEGYTISGYRNTPAETYAVQAGIVFRELGCKHQYFIYDMIAPAENQTGMTIYACSACGKRYLTAYQAPKEIASGKCGAHITYHIYDSGRLLLEGSGAMYDYCGKRVPWFRYNDSIFELQISGDVAQLSPYAFADMPHLQQFKCIDSRYFFTDRHSLLTADKSTLVLVPAVLTYTLPAGVQSLDATAFITTPRCVVTGNETITVNNGLLTDADGTILAALNYREDVLQTENDIRPYAFLLSEYPKRLRTQALTQTIGAQALGYYYDGALKKKNFVIEAYWDSAAVAYAHANGFEIDGFDGGTCGAQMEWHYADNQLIFSGSGRMRCYDTASAVPWASWLAETKTVMIDDAIEAVSDYAFYGGTQITTLVMPLSLQAPHNETVWYQCVNIASLTLTYGTGVMDDYCGRNGELYYKYTPWYNSRNAITDFSLDEQVRYIGVQAFRNAVFLKELTLTDCEEIAAYAFMSCSDLKRVMLYSKQTVLRDYALFSYQIAGNYKIYTFPVLVGYSDATARDYSVRMKCKFESLGCAHSRRLTAGESEESEGCCQAYTAYTCNDCGAVFYDYGVPAGGGHQINLTVKTYAGIVLADITYIVDGVAYQEIPQGIACGTHTVRIMADRLLLAELPITVAGEDKAGILTVCYGDYNQDGTVNAKDYAIARAKGYENGALFDYGKTRSYTVLWY